MPDIAQFTAPQHWRAIDLVSDLHLCEALPKTTQAFFEHLAHTDADAVFILGDLFEVWVGDDQGHRAFERACADALAAQAGLRWLGFMHGNRDFLVGPAFMRMASLHLLPDPLRLDAFGRVWLLTHGDALCLEDEPYQQFRKMVRSAQWQQDFLAQPFAARWELASRIRSESRSRKAAAPDPSLWADVDRTEAIGWLEQAQAVTLLHGHTHRPGNEDWENGLGRVVLSDWDIDGPADGAGRAEIVRLDAQGLSRRAPCKGAAIRTSTMSA